MYEHSVRNVLTVHPHGRGDGGVEVQGQVLPQRFTPTGVGTALASIIK